MIKLEEQLDKLINLITQLDILSTCHQPSCEYD